MSEQPYPRGEDNPGAKLTWPQVRSVRVLYATGEITQHQLALAFGVNRQCIFKIVNGLSWTDDPAMPRRGGAR